MRLRHRVSGLLLRHGIRFDDGTAWTQHHRDWLATITLLLPASPWATAVARLRCLRGVDTLTAVGLCSEIGDFQRFAHPEQLMSYLGLVPSEHTTGQSRRLGAITKTGSGHARRLLVEAAWKYRARPRIRKAFTDRRTGQPAEAIAIAYSANNACTAPHLATTRTTHQTTHHHRRRRRPRTGRLLLGHRPRLAR